MCLYIKDTQPRIADRDISVLKYLVKNGNEYRTPYTDIPVTLGELIVALPRNIYFRHRATDYSNRQIFAIESGAIHARLFENKRLVAFTGNSYGAAELVDWLNKKMFAYRCIEDKDMFESGLAIKAPDGMYN